MDRPLCAQPPGRPPSLTARATNVALPREVKRRLIAAARQRGVGLAVVITEAAEGWLREQAERAA